MVASVEMLVAARTQGAADLEKLAKQFDRLAAVARESGDAEAENYGRIATALAAAAQRTRDVSAMAAELEELAQAGRVTAAEAEELALQLGKLSRIDQAVNEFRAFEAQSKAASKALAEQQAKLQEVTDRYEGARRPSQRLTRELQQQTAATDAARQRYERLDAQLRTVSADLNRAGVDATQLASAQQHLSGSYAELAQRMASLRQVGDARELLGLQAHEDLADELTRIRRAYETLRTSGALSQRELAQAALRTEERIRELRRQTSGWTQSLNEAGSSLAGLAASGAGIGVVTKQAIDFESAMAEVAKVIDGTDAQIEALGERLKQLSTETLPLSAGELAKIAAVGGQLGVPTEKLERFVILAAKVGTAFGLSAEQAAESIGKLANVFNIPIDDIGRLTDAINVLGNTTAATEKDLLDFLTRTGGMAKQFGLSAEATAALGASLISLGKSPEVAATGINSLLGKLQQAGQQGPEFQASLARMGVSAQQLAADIRRDPQAALTEFLRTLDQLDNQSRAEILGQLFGQEYQDDISSLVGALGQFRTALAAVSDQSKVAGAVNTEFAKRAATTANQLELMKNALNVAAINLGTVFLPVVVDAAKGLGSMAAAIADFAKAHPQLAAMATTVVTLTASIGALRLSLLAMRVAGVGAFAELAAQSAALKLPIGEAVKQVGLLNSAFGVLAAGVAGYNLGGYLSDNFAIARKAGVALVQVFEHLSAASQLVRDVISAPFTDDTVEASLERYKARVAEIQSITAEMYAQAEQGTPAQIEAAKQAAAAAEQQAKAAKQAAQAQVQLGQAAQAAGKQAAAGQKVAIDKAEELIAKLKAIPETIRQSGEAGKLQIRATLGDALSQLTDVELTRLAKRAREEFGAVSQAAREIAGEAMRRLGLDADLALDGISQESRQAIAALDALGAAGVKSGGAIRSALLAAIAKADGAKAIEELRQRIEAFGKAGVLSADAVKQRLLELEQKARELAAGTDEVAASFARMGIKTKAELAALAAQAQADFKRINESGKAAPEGMLEAAQRWLEATKAAGDVAATGLAEAAVRAAEVRMELLGLKEVADAAGNAGRRAGEDVADGMAAAKEGIDSTRQATAHLGDILAQMRAYQVGLRDDLARLSEAAADAFQERRGIEWSADAASDSMRSLAEQARAAWAEVGNLQQQALSTGNEFGRWYAAAEGQAAAVRAEFLEQADAAERLSASYRDMDVSLSSQVPTLDQLRTQFSLLDDNQLDTLNGALDGARQRLQALQDEARAARASLQEMNDQLQDELDRAAGNDAAILERQIAEQKARIEQLRQQAGSDLGAQRAADDALARLEAKRRVELAEIAERKRSGQADAATSAAQPAAGAPSRTERLVVEIGGKSTVLDNLAPGQGDQVKALLVQIANAKSVAFGGG
ncbi:phage tail tape measure protein [Chitinimonas koreensis]|uniref:phage tail tape measure protein n=1 Tax=Chitinimonas koreensis TaxID=356302 RepID=UPI000400E14D|nr:phage tail tape measure protein [Chitinimonas koreensis]QNM94899.1 phage tail tape measure protein [Chitinimonas koreensis]